MAHKCFQKILHMCSHAFVILASHSEMMTQIFTLLQRQWVWREHSRIYHNLSQTSHVLMNLISSSIQCRTLLHLPVSPLSLTHYILHFSLAYGNTCLPGDHSNQYTNMLDLRHFLLREETFPRSCIPTLTPACLYWKKEKNFTISCYHFLNS